MKEDVTSEWGYTHPGFPCGSFSMVRHKVAGQPGPVRDKLHIYGLPGMRASQQAEADRGTRMAAQAAEISMRPRSTAAPPVKFLLLGRWKIRRETKSLGALGMYPKLMDV